MSNTPIGVINEVGDLGLGFDPLTADEQRQVEESSRDTSTTSETK